MFTLKPSDPDFLGHAIAVMLHAQGLEEITLTEAQAQATGERYENPAVLIEQLPDSLRFRVMPQAQAEQAVAEYHAANPLPSG